MQTFLLLLVAVAAGFVVPLQSIINGRLGHLLENPLLAALVSFAGGTVALSLIILVTTPGIPQIATEGKSFPWYLFTGGLFGAVFVTSVLTLVPRIGATNVARRGGRRPVHHGPDRRPLRDSGRAAHHRQPDADCWLPAAGCRHAADQPRVTDNTGRRQRGDRSVIRLLLAARTPATPTGRTRHTNDADRQQCQRGWFGRRVGATAGRVRRQVGSE